MEPKEAWTTSDTEAERPRELRTVIAAEPGVAIKVALTVASNWVPFTKVVGSLVPIHWTTVPESKPEPFTASVKFPPPAITEPGFRRAMAGVLHCVASPIARLYPFTEPKPVTRSYPGPAE